MSNNHDVEPTSPSRRSVVKGAAWAVPAVVVAGAAPALAASQCLTATFGGVSCKWPGTGQNNWGYKLQICFTNNCDVTANIHVSAIQGNAASSPLFPVSQDFNLPPHSQEQCGPVVIYCSKNSSNFINITFTVNGGAPQVMQLPSPVQTCEGPQEPCGNPV
jgi:hypothetical protein